MAKLLTVSTAKTTCKLVMHCCVQENSKNNQKQTKPPVMITLFVLRFSFRFEREAFFAFLAKLSDRVKPSDRWHIVRVLLFL